MNPLNEIWLSVVGYEGRYEVSNLGRIKSVGRISYNVQVGHYRIKEKIRRPRNSKGYLNIDLYIDGVGTVLSVHRIVATAFIQNPENLPFVNHLDKNKSNNNTSNLEWTSQRENESHKSIGLTSSKFVGVSWNRRMNKWRSYITVNKRQIHLGFFKDELQASYAYRNALHSFEIKNKYA